MKNRLPKSRASEKVSHPHERRADDLESQLAAAPLGGTIRRALIAGWLSRGIESFLPLQERALAEMSPSAGASSPPAAAGYPPNLLICAPTSAGKTLAAEIAIAHHLSAGRRAAYLVPTRALAEEKSAEFTRWLAPAGFRVLCATRDHPESDPPAGRGEFDLLVAVYEKMNHYLLTQPQILTGLGVVAADEIQLLGDCERGAALDLLLTKLKLSARPPQLIALSAVIPESTAKTLCGWLGCRLIADESRPRELREGVLDISSGIFRFRTNAPGGTDDEQLGGAEELERLLSLLSQTAAEWSGPGEISALALLAAAVHLGLRGEPTLIFAPTRQASREWAGWLAKMPEAFSPARLILPRLAEAEPARSNELLRSCLERGIGFHNADLSEEQRALIEEGFRSGEIRIVVSTPTLAMGVNLAGRNVLQYPWRVGNDGNGGRPTRLPLGRARFANQGGRAARFGLGEEFGRSMGVASSPAEAGRFWEELICAPPEVLDPPLARAPFSSVLLDLIAGRTGGNAASLGLAAEATFSFSAGWNPEESTIADCARDCEALGLVRDDSGGLALTGFGETTAAMGLSVQTAVTLRKWIEDFAAAGDNRGGGEDWGEELFALLAMTAEGRRAIMGLGGAGRAKIEEGRRGPAGLPAREERAAFRAAAILKDWVDGVQTEEIEMKYGAHCGSIARAGTEMAWLANGAAAIARALACPSAANLKCEKLAASLSALSERLRHGIHEEGLPLARLGVSGLGRTAILRLLAAGYDSPRAAAEAGRSALGAVIGQDLATRLEDAAGKSLKRNMTGTQAGRAIGGGTLGAREITQNPQQARLVRNGSDPLLVINLKSPGIIRAAGREIPLPPLSFELLAALAERPGEVVTRGALYQRLWPEGGPEDQQLDGHRRALLKRLRPMLGSHAAMIAEVVRGIGMRMALPADQIFLRR